MVNKEQTRTAGGRIYEIGYLLSPMIPVESLAERVSKNLTAPIASLGGEIMNEVSPRHLTLAYPIKKNMEHRRLTFREAFFGSIRFQTLPRAAAELRSKLVASPDLVRHLLIEVPKATLLDEERAKARVNHPPRSPVPAETAGEVSSQPSLSLAEMDQQIDQLLTTEAYTPK